MEKSPKPTEYIFVDFNAWEYARRTSVGRRVRPADRKVEDGIQKGAGDDDDKQDFKKKWRVKQAVRALKKKYGLTGLRARLSLLVLSCRRSRAVVILEAAGLLHAFERRARALCYSLVGAALGVAAALATAVPSARPVAASNHESNTSRGEAIFDEAKGVKDHLGFMSKVKHELDELFEFLEILRKRQSSLWSSCSSSTTSIGASEGATCACSRRFS